jgi:hypothetical protein
MLTYQPVACSRIVGDESLFFQKTPPALDALKLLDPSYNDLPPGKLRNKNGLGAGSYDQA